MIISRKSLLIFMAVLIPLLIWLSIIIYALPSRPVREGKYNTAHRSNLFRIGVSLGLTGEYSEPAKMQEKAYRLWEKEINKKGGLLGRPVEIVIMNDESNPEKAKKIYRSLITEKQVDFVFGPYSSDITKAVSPIADEFGYPMLAPGTAADSIWQQGYKNIIGILTPASRYTEGILKLAKLYGLEKVSILHADDEFSIQAAKGAQKWVSQLGINIVMVEEFKKGTRNLIPLAQKAKKVSAELVLIGGHFNESVDMRQAFDRIDWYPKAFFATIGPALKKYQETLGPNAEYSFATSLWESDKSNFPGAKEFAAAFEKYYGQEPSYQAADAFAAGQILEAAIELAGSFDRDRIRQAFYDLDKHFIIGRYQVDKTGMQIKRFPLTIQWQKGKKEIVWPEKLRTKEPVFK